MSSRRLAGKVLAELAGRPMLWHIVERLSYARSLEFVGVATSDEASDDPIAEFCDDHGIPCFRGSLDDVLGRTVDAAEHWQLDPVVRITGDCPFVCPDAVDRLVDALIRERADYVEFTRRTVHVGIDPFSLAILQRFDRTGASDEEREHLALLVPHHRDHFRVAAAEPASGHRVRPNLKLSVDEAHELAFARTVYAALQKQDEPFSTDALLGWLDGRPRPSRELPLAAKSPRPA